MKKTNAMRLLDRAKIKYNAISYNVDESDLGAVHVAESLGQNIKQVFKTLVIEGDKSGYVVACIPGAEEVDLKKLSVLSGNKRCTMLHMKDLLSVTGYIRGGCSPVGMKKPFPIYFDKTAIEYDTIFISAGVRGVQIEINPQVIVDFIGAQMGDLVYNAVKF